MTVSLDMLQSVGVSKEDAQFHLLKFSESDEVRGKLLALDEFLNEYLAYIIAHACNCAAAKSPGIQLFRALSYSPGGYRRNVNFYPAWMKKVDARVPGFSRKLHGLINAWGRVVNTYMRSPAVPTAMTHSWVQANIFVREHAPAHIFIEDTPFLGLWLKLRDKPSSLHTDKEDVVPTINVRLRMEGSSQGPGKVFAVQTDPESEELSAPKREAFDGYGGMWTQKTHGAIPG